MHPTAILVQDTLITAQNHPDIKNLTQSIHVLERQISALISESTPRWGVCPPLSFSCRINREADGTAALYAQQMIRQFDQEHQGYYKDYKPSLMKIARESLRSEDRKYVSRYFPEFYGTLITYDQLVKHLEDPMTPRPTSQEK